MAGARRADGSGFADTVATLKSNLAAARPHGRADIDDPKIAMMANSGGHWTIRPYHTTGDGDQLFAVSTGRLPSTVPVSVMGAVAAEVVAEAIVRGALAATSVDGWPAAADLR